MHRTTWEYKTIKGKTEGWLGGRLDASDLEERLNQAGAEGWELVSTVYGHSGAIALILKRPIAE